MSVLTAEEVGIDPTLFEGMIKRFGETIGVSVECHCGKCELSSAEAEKFQRERQAIQLPTAGRMKEILRRLDLEEGCLAAETKGWLRDVYGFEERLRAFL